MAFSINNLTGNISSYFSSVTSYLDYSRMRVVSGKSVFRPADDAIKASFSSAALIRSLTINENNDTISTKLKALEAADASLRYARGLVQQMNNLATQALNAGTAAGQPVSAGSSLPKVAATSSANIDANTVVDAPAGHIMSITSDNGQNFRYTLQAGDTWGNVANAFNAANIGVTFRFDTGNAAAPRMSIESTDGTTGFRIEAVTSRYIMDDLAGMNSPYDGGMSLGKFNYGTHEVLVSPTTGGGMSFGSGGAVVARGAEWRYAAGSSISFTGSDGVSHTWSTSTDKASDQVAAEINAMGTGVRAEFTDQGQLRLRDIAGGSISVSSGTGSFDPGTGRARFENPNGAPVAVPIPVPGGTAEQQLSAYGQMYDALRTDLATAYTNAGGAVNGLVDFSVSPLAGMITPGANWNSPDAISASLAEGMQAQADIDRLTHHMTADRSLLRNTLTFNAEFASDLSIIGNSVVESSVEEDSAILTALQIRQNLMAGGFAAGAKYAKGLLKLVA